MHPTPRALELSHPVGQALELLAASIGTQPEFTPASSRRRFVLATIDLGEANLLPRLLPWLRQEAPGVALACVIRPYDRYREALESGSADLAWGRLPPGQADFMQQPLFPDPWVCLARRDHPRIRTTLSMTQFLEAEEVVVSAPEIPASMVPGALGRRASKRRIVLEVSHYLSIPMVLENSDLISVVPRTLATNMAARYSLKVLKLPFPVPVPVIRQFWHKRMQHDPGHRWFRSAIADLFRRPPAANPARVSPA